MSELRNVLRRLNGMSAGTTSGSTASGVPYQKATPMVRLATTEATVATTIERTRPPMAALYVRLRA